MTNYAKQLTKEYLMSLGITEVTEDGEHIFKGDKELTQHTHKDGYKRVTLYDKELHQMLYPLTKCSSCGQLIFGVHRIVYAWFHGIANSELVIDHIDNNKANNNINNLQELTPTQNICKNKVVNQNLRPCNMHKSREFYEDKLNELLAKYEAAKKDEDAEVVHGLRSRIAQVRDNIRYWDANSDKYHMFQELDRLNDDLIKFRANFRQYKTQKDSQAKLYTSYSRMMLKRIRNNIAELKQQIKEFKEDID